MIIKSMSRKVPSFGQLLGYITREDCEDEFSIRHNVFARDYEDIRREFEHNGTLLSRRKNSVYLFHEIISLTRAKGLDASLQKQKLREIAQEYISARCPDNLVFGGLHADKDHSFHMHLMVSANRAGEAKRQRLTKHQFREIAVRLEQHVLETYTELEQTLAIGKRSDRKRSQGEAEMERRTGKRPAREELLQRVKAAYRGSSDRDSLLSAFGYENLELYIRGKNIGVIDHETGKKHRLKTIDATLMGNIEERLSETPEKRGYTKERRSEKEAETEMQSSLPEKEQDMKQSPEAETKPDTEVEAEKGTIIDKGLSPVQEAWKKSMDEMRGIKDEVQRNITGKDNSKDNEPER